jgi:hypothetical protein
VIADPIEVVDSQGQMCRSGPLNICEDRLPERTAVRHQLDPRPATRLEEGGVRDRFGMPDESSEIARVEAFLPREKFEI